MDGGKRGGKGGHVVGRAFHCEDCEGLNGTRGSRREGGNYSKSRPVDP